LPIVTDILKYIRIDFITAEFKTYFIDVS